MKLRRKLPLLTLSLLLLAACAHHPVVPQAGAALSVASVGTEYLERDDVKQYMARVRQQDGFEQAWLEHAFGGARKRQTVIDAITRPYESKPWFQYQGIFVNEARINGGVAFWDQQAATLARAEAQFGVPAEIIVAIIGIESFYGKQHGGYPVMDALTTLSFDYPARMTFFQGELEQFLLLCRDQSLDPLVPMGSYAGAMGAPQFMPDSYRQYAVDFDGDGKRDIWQDWPDIIGSVANYFHAHGWEKDGLTVVPAAASAASPAAVALAPTTVGALRKADVILSAGVPDDAEAMLVALQEEHDRQSYWVGLHNFRVITQYNKSPLYAMAVVDLAEAISARRMQQRRAAMQ